MLGSPAHVRGASDSRMEGPLGVGTHSALGSNSGSTI